MRLFLIVLCLLPVHCRWYYLILNLFRLRQFARRAARLRHAPHEHQNVAASNPCIHILFV